MVIAPFKFGQVEHLRSILDNFGNFKQLHFNLGNIQNLHLNLRTITNIWADSRSFNHIWVIETASFKHGYNWNHLDKFEISFRFAYEIYYKYLAKL